MRGNWALAVALGACLLAHSHTSLAQTEEGAFSHEAGMLFLYSDCQLAAPSDDNERTQALVDYANNFFKENNYSETVIAHNAQIFGTCAQIELDFLNRDPFSFTAESGVENNRGWNVRLASSLSEDFHYAGLDDFIFIYKYPLHSQTVEFGGDGLISHGRNVHVPDHLDFPHLYNLADNDVEYQIFLIGNDANSSLLSPATIEAATETRRHVRETLAELRRNIPTLIEIRNREGSDPLKPHFVPANPTGKDKTITIEAVRGFVTSNSWEVLTLSTGIDFTTCLAGNTKDHYLASIFLTGLHTTKIRPFYEHKAPPKELYKGNLMIHPSREAKERELERMLQAFLDKTNNCERY